MNRSRSRDEFHVEDLRREVSEGRVSPFYLLHGDDDFGCERAAKWLQQALEPAATEFNLDIFYGDDIDVEHFLRIYWSYPMMAAHRLVLLRRLDCMPSLAMTELAEQLATPSESSVLIVTGAKIDQRRKFVQLLSNHGRKLSFRLPYENRLPDWIRQYASQGGIQIESEVADLLAAYIGVNLREVATELEKLVTFVGQDRKISRNDVEQVVVANRSSNIFELTDALGSRNRPRSLELMDEILIGGEEPLRALALIYRHFQLLHRAKLLLRERASRATMVKELGVSPFFLNGYLKQAGAYSSADLWASMGAIVTADIGVKSTGRRQHRSQMALLVHRLCGEGCLGG